MAQELSSAAPTVRSASWSSVSQSKSGDRAFSPGRHNNFDFLRLCLAILVIFGHSYLLTGNLNSEPLYSLTYSLTNGYGLGHLAVEGFFAISGFLITQSWMSNPRLGLYLKKRVLRICPGFWVATMFSVFVAAPLFADSISAYFSTFSFRRFILRLLLLQPIVGADPSVFTRLPHLAINGSLWSISYEWLCYLLVPVLAWLGLLGRRWWLLGLFLASYIVHNRFPGMADAAVGTMSLNVAVEQSMYFLSGMLLYLWRGQILSPNLLGVFSGAMLVVSILLGLTDWAAPFLVAPIMFAIAFTPLIKLHHVAKHGDFSYGIYLYAFPVQQLLVTHGFHSVFGLFWSALPVTLFLAALSWRWIEGPALKLKNSKTIV